MKDKQVILLDMDGTINDSAEGIVNGTLYTFRQFGINDRSREDIMQYIGPPVTQTFRQVFGFDNERAEQAGRVFWDYMMERGFCENKVYAGIGDLLKKLKSQGKKVALATAKWLASAQKCLKYFGLEKYFDFVSGIEGARADKSAVIGYALEGLGVADKSTAVMVGDRTHDILGALENGIDSVGVLYGYGTYEELSPLRPTRIVKDVKELTALLCG